MKPDIQSRNDIELFIYAFYQKAINDKTIGHFFEHIMGEQFDEHLHTICQFWATLLLQEGSYQGRLIQKHLILDQKHTIEAKHMERWQFLFYETLDQMFAGPIADDAKRRVEIMGSLMLAKINYLRNNNAII